MATKDAVLQALQNSEGAFLSGEELSNKLSVSRTTVWKAIKALREEGHPIEAVTNRGYMLMSDSWTITEDSLRACLPTRYKNLDLHIYDTIDSTNLKARQLAMDGAPHGTVVLAKQQTSGRGRLGRSFFSPREGIYLSIVIKPDFDVSKSVLVTSAAAVAVANAIEKVCGLESKIKWVNDVYIDGKKVCGILTEAGADIESGQLEWLVVGIGLNLTATAEDFPPELAAKAGSLYPSGPAPVSRAALAGAIARQLLALCPAFDCLDEYRARCFVPGHWVTVCTGTETYAAQALSIDDAGRLVVQREGGRTEALRCGEVTTRPARTE